MIVRIVAVLACLPVMAAAQAPAPEPSPAPASAPASTLAPQPAHCFDIVTLPANMQPYSPVLLNHCSGASWMLGHENITDANGKLTNEFVYRWYPLNISAEEAFLLKAGGSPIPPVKPAAPSTAAPIPSATAPSDGARKSANPQ